LVILRFLTTLIATSVLSRLATPSLTMLKPPLDENGREERLGRENRGDAATERQTNGQGMKENNKFRMNTYGERNSKRKVEGQWQKKGPVR